ncbi:MAG: hypothetical protein QM536_04535 [Chitinophagaceae bacterium]|nr:hypothetical protein [Chitinophagaceae bacterium]
MKTYLVIIIIVFFTWGCDNGNDNGGVTPSGVAELSGEISQNRTLTANNKYTLKGFVYVKSGVILTIEAGTIIKGDKNTKGSLIVLPGAKIIAEGTKENPIVFTSSQERGSRSAGDWGGIIILGNAPVNKTPIVIEGENVSTFGGNNAADNSGILRYVRVEFAGIAFEPDKEINGLTFGGVGNGTTVDYVQVSYSGDDSFEWFGGTVNATHLISLSPVDDDFDTDNGFSGRVQFGLSIRDPKVSDQCACSSSNAFESDNDGAGTAAIPQTSAKFANMSIFISEGTPNSKYNDGILIRRNSALSIYNSLIIGAYPKAGLELNGSASQANYKSGASVIQGLVLIGMTKPILTTDSVKFYSNNNYTHWTVADVLLPETFNSLKNPSFLPQSASPLLNRGIALPSDFRTSPYIGAFSTENWTESWTNFDPQNTNY